MSRTKRAIGLAVQYTKFSVVGLGATLVHVSIYAGTVEWVNLDPMIANLTAFCVAFTVSFFGHRDWTFEAPGGNSISPTMMKFGCVAMLGLGLNSASVCVATGLLKLSYLYAILPMATAIPITTFLLNRYWVFRSAQKKRPAKAGRLFRDLPDRLS